MRESSATACDASGHGAPILIHSLRSAICCGVSFPFFGIFKSPLCFTAPINRLASGFFGTIAGPLSPPLSMAARLSSRRLNSCFFGPWHSKQRSARTGRIRFSTKSISAGVWARAIAADIAPTNNRNRIAVTLRLPNGAWEGIQEVYVGLDPAQSPGGLSNAESEVPVRQLPDMPQIQIARLPRHLPEKGK